jgi:SAM-dependent methyltransferase
MAIFPALVCAGCAVTNDRPDMSTDVAWEEWGQRDPYFGVITNPKYRRDGLNEDAKREFFDGGDALVKFLLATIQRRIDPQFVPKKVLDFGCGVGRLLVPFARVAEEVVGLDVSPSMLDEARRNCEERQLRNVRLMPSNDNLSTLRGTFDLIHSCLVFQHIPPQRGRAIFGKLLQHLRPGGIGAIQLTYSKARFASTHGVAPSALPRSATRRQSIPSDVDPEMQMNSYNMNEILFLIQCRGVQQIHLEFSDHGGELGVFLFFAATGAPIAIEA